MLPWSFACSFFSYGDGSCVPFASDSTSNAACFSMPSGYRVGCGRGLYAASVPFTGTANPTTECVFRYYSSSPVVHWPLW
jgi:hypothetical protein